MSSGSAGSTGSSTGSLSILFSSLLANGGASPNLDPTNTNLSGNGITSIKTIDNQTLNQAYTALLGVMTNDPTTILAAGAAVHQPLNGYTQATATQGTGQASVLLGAVPAGFYQSGTTITPPDQLDPNVFDTWSSEYQSEYIYLAMGGAAVDYNSNYQTALAAATTQAQKIEVQGVLLPLGGQTPPGFTNVYTGLLGSAVPQSLFGTLPAASQAWYDKVTGVDNNTYYVFDPSLFTSQYQAQNPIPTAQASSYAKIAAGGTDYRVSGGYIQIGKNNTAGSTPLDFYISPSETASGTPIYSGGQITCLEMLTKTSFATMDTTTQQNIANYDSVMGGTAFQTLQKTLNLNTDLNGNVLSLSAAKSTNLALVDNSIAKIIASAGQDGVDIATTKDSNGNITGFAFTGQGYTQTQNKFLDGRLINYNDVVVFLNELLNLRSQMQNMSVFSINDINTKIDAIQTRFNQVEAFGIIPDQVSASDLGAYWQQQYGTGLHDSQGQFDSTGYLVKNVVDSDTPSRSAIDTSAVGPIGPITSTNVYYYKIQGDSQNGQADDFLATEGKQSSNGGQYSDAIQADTQYYQNVQAAQNQGLNAGDIVQINPTSTNVITDAYAQKDGNNNFTQYLVQTSNNGSPLYADGVVQPASDPNKNPYTVVQQNKDNLSNSVFNASLTVADINPNLNANQPVNVEVQGVEMIKSSTTDNGSTLASTIVGSNQSTMASGYQKLMQAEQQTLALQNQMNTVAAQQTIAVQNGNTTINKQLDAPTLIFFLQLYTNLIDEQQNAASTEMVNQQNDLLNTYSQMQDLVNSVQGKYKAGSDGQTQQLDIFGNDAKSGPTAGNGSINNDANALTNQTVATLANSASVGQSNITLLSMFDTGMNTNPNPNVPQVLNPIENLFKIQRPTMQFFDDSQGGTMDSVGYTSTAWNSFGTSLSNAVTQINQQTQIMMNNIDSLDKEKNQHFDLANNCLSKLNDILAAIGRNVN